MKSHNDRYAAVRKFDPEIGSALSLPQISKGSPVLLVAVGDCMACTVGAYDISKIKRPNGTKIVLLRTVKSAKLTAEVKGARYVDDPGSVTQALNAAWFPRWYYYDADLRLADLQTDPKDLEVLTE